MVADVMPLRIAARFTGPPDSANGGWTCGLVAEALADPWGSAAVEVTLRQPPPLETRLELTCAPDSGADSAPGPATLTFGGAIVAEAVPTQLTVDPVDPVSYDDALAAMSSYAGWWSHPFPGCFACGTSREPPDGLGLRPGRLPDRADCVATGWRPDPSLVDDDGRASVPAMWAALDCPGGWSADLAGRPMVLGRMAAGIDVRPSVGDACVVLGRWLGEERRKTFTATTAYDDQGRVLARALQTWIAIG